MHIVLSFPHYLHIPYFFSEDGRVVTQMQYLSWPDHGTPDDSTQFVEFVEEVRDMRAKSVQARQAKTSTVDNIEVYIFSLFYPNHITDKCTLILFMFLF